MAQALAGAAAHDSIAARDKTLMALQQQIELKEAQLIEDYRRVQKNVKHNPPLQAALDEYRSYFTAKAEEKKKEVKALAALLNDVKTTDEQFAIKREIKNIKQK